MCLHDPSTTIVLLNLQMLRQISIRSFFEECVGSYHPAFRQRGLDPQKGRRSSHMLDLYPAFITTGDVRPNLRKNMPSYRKSRGNSNRYIVACSKIVNNTERKKIEKLAANHGFTKLVQVYDKKAIASFLRHDSPYWRKSLLGIHVNLSALSDTPISRRASSNVGLVGRERAREWLKSLSEDALIVGEPGAGKTALLKEFVREMKGKGCRERLRWPMLIWEKRPDIIIADDAHEDKDFLSKRGTFDPPETMTSRLSQHVGQG